MIKAERMIKKYGPQFHWSPKLAISILELTIWKLIKSALKTKHHEIQKFANSHPVSQT